MIKQVSKLKKEIEEMRDKYDEHERKVRSTYLNIYCIFSLFQMKPS